MTEDFQFTPGPWMYQHDSFGSERENFEGDVHMLILSCLDAGITKLENEAQKQDDELAALDTSQGITAGELQGLFEVSMAELLVWRGIENDLILHLRQLAGPVQSVAVRWAK